VAEVDRRLAELWREASTGDRAVVRACMMNLVVCCEQARDLAKATLMVGRLSDTLPARALVVVPAEGSAGNDLEVYVSTHCHPRPDGKQVCSEQVTLRIRGEGLGLVPPTVLRLLEADCPVHTCWRRARLALDPLFEPLVGLSDRFIADNHATADPRASLAALHGIVSDPARRARVGDLAWIRLESWRDVVASLFDAPASRPWLGRIRRVEVAAGGPAWDSGATVSGAYLAGWLAAQLGWHPLALGDTWTDGTTGREIRIELRDDLAAGTGEVAKVLLEADAVTGGPAAAFEVRRLPEELDLVRVSCVLGGSAQSSYVRKLSRLDDLSLLVGSMQRRERDAVYAAALGAAVKAAGISR
jgi:glucose-6-phosphate dehydrogenase assembly protein OpcA